MRDTRGKFLVSLLLFILGHKKVIYFANAILCGVIGLRFELFLNLNIGYVSTP